MTVVEQLAEFAVRSDVASLSRSTLLQLKIRILDALACAPCVRFVLRSRRARSVLARRTGGA